MKIQYTQKIISRFLKDLATSKIIGEIELRLDPEALSWAHMDMSHIILVYGSIPKTAFDIYDVPTSATFLLEADDLKQALTAATPKGKKKECPPITWEIHIIKETRTLVISWEEDGDLQQIAIDESQSDKEDQIDLGVLFTQKYSHTIGLSFPQFKRLINRSVGGSTVDFSLNDGKLFEKVADHSWYHQTYSLKYEGNQAPLPDAGTFAVPFLRSAMKLFPPTETIELKLKSDTPLLGNVVYPNGAEIGFCLAPRVKDEEDDDNE